MLNIQKYIIILSSVLLFSCHKDGGDIQVAGTPMNATTIYVDTFSVEMSTVLMDSLITSTSSRILVGSYLDADLGKVSANTFFELSLGLIDTDSDGHEDIIAPDAIDPVYDSLVLILPYVYSYGDTTQTQTIHVHRINQSMSYVGATGYLYNSSSFTYNNTPLASFSFKPTRDMDASMRIHMDDNLGQEIFALAQQKSYKVANNTDFREYFKGLILRSDLAVNNFVAGFNTTPKLILYYHEAADPETAKSYSFKHASDDKHFNQILNNRSSTGLSSLVSEYQAIPSAQSNNQSYFLSGISLMTKFRIPHLHELRTVYPNFIISKAYLVISPKYNSYTAQYPLPQSLMLYLTDEYNYPTSTIEYDNYTSTQYVSPVIDYETQQNTSYKFELTKFIQDEIKYATDTRRGLLLTNGTVASSRGVEKMIVAENNPQNKGAKLILYITVKQ